MNEQTVREAVEAIVLRAEDYKVSYPFWQEHDQAIISPRAELLRFNVRATNGDSFMELSGRLNSPWDTYKYIHDRFGPVAITLVAFCEGARGLQDCHEVLTLCPCMLAKYGKACARAVDVVAGLLLRRSVAGKDCKSAFMEQVERHMDWAGLNLDFWEAEFSGRKHEPDDNVPPTLMFDLPATEILEVDAA